MTTELWFITMCWAIAVILFITYPLVKKALKNRAKGKEEIPLSDMQRAFFIDSVMPCCGSEEYKLGPRGGMMLNIMCSGCGDEFCVSLDESMKYIKPITRSVQHKT